MADDDQMPGESELDAAERALGTLSRGNDRGAEAAQTRIWDRILSPLALALPDAAVPRGIFDRVMRQISDEGNAARADRAERGEKRARRLAGLSLAMATALGLALVVQKPGVPFGDEENSRYVAVVTPEGTGQALVVAIDLETGQALVRAVGIEAPSGRSLQLWSIEGDAAPRSLGLIDTNKPVRRAMEAQPGALIAVSSEPPGGSPTGLPTGPVLYTGPLVALE